MYSGQGITVDNRSGPRSSRSEERGGNVKLKGSLNKEPRRRTLGLHQMMPKSSVAPTSGARNSRTISGVLPVTRDMT
jgi:hypothetical protein